MTSASDFYAQAVTRRRFGQWGLVAATAGVAGCGGGGEGEELPVVPPAKVGALELVAGALGGGGFALQQGAMARLLDELCGPAFNSQGDFQFVSGTYAVAWGAEAGKGCRRFLRSPRLSMDCCLTPWTVTS